MTTKLNLTIDEGTARKIKKYAQKRNTSVSKLTENYFKRLLNNNNAENKKSFVEKYAGIIKDIKIDNIDKNRDEYLKEKYGI